MAEKRAKYLYDENRPKRVIVNIHDLDMNRKPNGYMVRQPEKPLPSPCFIFIAILFMLWFVSCIYSTVFDTSFYQRLEKNTLFVVAHPDDETMFFSPTVLGMQEERGSNLYLLVISNGGHDGLGLERTREMMHAASHLGFAGHEVFNHLDLQDNPDVDWNIEKIIE
jgi:hypothetical protein